MKSISMLTNKLNFIFILFLGLSCAQGAIDEQPCAVVVRSGKGVQIIPPQGKVQTHFDSENPVACGSMLITQQETFWVRLSDQTVVKIAPHSFIEMPKANTKVYRVYRGAALVSAPPGIYTQTWSTPNSDSIFKGGVAFIQYSTTDHLTTVGCFNRNFEFKNKFNSDASQIVHAGETSHLMIQDAQVTPTQPAVMSHGSVLETLADLSLPEADHKELVEIVKRVYEDRAKSLASEIEEWEEAPAVGAKPARTIASVKAGKAQKAVNPKEAAFVSAQLRTRLYGSEEDQKTLEKSRNPASASESKGLKDTEHLKQQKNFHD